MAVQNSLARQDQSMKLSVYLQNDAVKKQINQVVGGKNGTRFISSIVSAVQSTPALQECTSPSIVNAALLGEALNLSPSPQLGQFYMVPFDNKKKGCKEAQFQLGYKGYIQLAIRSGYYKKLNVLATLAPALGAVTALSMGKDLRTGEVEAVEIGNQISGQMSVQDVPGVVPEVGTTVVDGKVIDKATGEVVADSVPEHAGKVIDLRTAKQA